MKLTQDIKLAAFRRQRKLLQHLSTKDSERNLCQNLLTIENTDSDLKVHALHYANALLKNLPLQTNRAITNYQKQVLVLVKHCLGNSQINAMPEQTVFFHNFFRTRNLCQNLLTIENTNSDLKAHALHYANELLKNFCKLATANKQSNNKLSKTGFGFG